jgi:murein DD-endopeptidase MepM/ murein hydrolase activator NlpD
MKPKIDGLMIAALALIIFLGTSLISDVATASTLQPAAASQLIPQETESDLTDPAAFGALYLSYIITQGPHGFSYGQMAVDLAAGEGETILSPISGVVTENYTDVYGNPTLVIENDVYRVTLLHGDYFVTITQSVTIGEPIGSESNHGYTTDMVGNLCWGRAGCGFHTHLNVFDKRQGINVNPLDLLP